MAEQEAVTLAGPSMSMLLLVRHSDDLGRACEELSDLFAIRRRMAPGWTPGPLLGMWLEPCLAGKALTTLPVRRELLDGGPVRVRECSGLPGIWTLCSLDGEGISRLALLEALLQVSDASGGCDPPGRFIPVFRSDLAKSVAAAQIRGLRDEHPRRVLAPWHQDPSTGRLSPPGAPSGSYPAPEAVDPSRS